MRSFRQFFNERSSQMPFTAATQMTGNFDLPDLTNFEPVGDRPVGGYNSLQQVATAASNNYRYQDSDSYRLRTVLEKYRALVENIMYSIKLKQTQLAAGGNPSMPHTQKNYENAQYDPTRQIIYGISKQEIINGDYPRFHNTEMGLGEQMKILTVDPRRPNLYVVHINVLREEMEKLRIQLQSQELRHQRIGNLAGIADKTLQSSLTSRHNVPDFTGAS